MAFAADIYGLELRPPPAEGATTVHRFFAHPALWSARVRGAFTQMLRTPGIDPGRTAAIGYCFGGGSVQLLARLGVDLRAAISFHGAMPTEPGPEHIRARLLLLRGDADPLVDRDAVEAVTAQLRTVPTIDWQVVWYSGALHAFAVPGANASDRGAQFDARAERRSWEAAKAFLADALA